MRIFFSSALIAAGLVVAGCNGALGFQRQAAPVSDARAGGNPSPIQAANRHMIANADTADADSRLIGNVWSLRMEHQKRTMQHIAEGTGVQVSQTEDNRLRMDIPGDASFEADRSRIKSSFRPVLDGFADTLADNPSTVVNIISHDYHDLGGPDSPALDSDHATQLRDYLVSRGVAPARLHVDGNSEQTPPGSTIEASKIPEKRRVEIYVAEQQSTAQVTHPIYR